MQSGYIYNLENEAPDFCNLMQQRGVFSTLQCIIGTRDNIKGLVTFNKCRESARWADYEIDCAIIFSTVLSMSEATIL